MAIKCNFIHSFGPKLVALVVKAEAYRETQVPHSLEPLKHKNAELQLDGLGLREC